MNQEDTTRRAHAAERSMTMKEGRELSWEEVEQRAAAVVGAYLARGLDLAAELLIAADDPEDSKAIGQAIHKGAGALAPSLVSALIDARGRAVGDGAIVDSDILRAELASVLTDAFCA